ncbi:MAG: anhydro-N-acetylmuramic acid kinase [Hasllibacter sp.]
MGRKSVEAAGCMSGTSLDGVDAAVLVTDGTRIEGFGPSAYSAYSGAERDAIRAALGRWPGEDGVAGAARAVEDAHARLLAELPGAPIGFHGQTLAHEPGGRGTHQCGDGALLAAALGRTVVWDFRSDDVAAGGQGAPLAPVFHHACARWAGLGPCAFLNLGGVGNLTYVGAGGPEEALLAFDTGPANAPLDDLMAARGLGRFDEGGRLAAAGEVDEGVIEALLSGGYFARMPPKSLDRDDFRDLGPAVAALGDADAAATLTAAAAACVARGLEHLPERPGRILVTGGGRRNAAMMAMVSELSGVPAVPVEEVGLDGDMLEAQAFAYLAVRVLAGLPTGFPRTTGVPAPLGGGRVSRATPRSGR